MIGMKERREGPVQESKRRDPRAVYSYDERMPRHKSKGAGSQDDRNGDNSVPRHRSTVIRPHERQRDRDSISYYQSRSGHTNQLMSSEEAQKAIRTLFIHVKETTSFFANFKEEYQQDVRSIEAYAGQTILEKLWERKIRNNDSKGRPSKGRSKDEAVGLRSAFDDASSRLWASLNDACEGAKSHPSGQNVSLARKLEVAIKDIGRLLASVRTYFQEMDGLIKELKLLKVVLELGGAGTASNDDRVNRRPRAHGAGHGHVRDSSPEREDARYDGMGEGSGSEDNCQRDEQHGEHSGGRDGSEVGGDEEGQGLVPIGQPVESITNA